MLLDDYTSNWAVSLLQKKSELFEALVAYNMRLEAEHKEPWFKLTNICMDRAEENTAEVVQQFCL